MLTTHSGFSLFVDYDLGVNLDAMLSKLQKEIESDHKILDQGEDEYTATKIKQHQISPLVLHTDKITVSEQEVMVPGGFFPSGFIDVEESGESYSKTAFVFHLPFEGDLQLLKCRPSSFLMWTEEISVSNNEINFEIINFNNDVSAIQKERDQFLSRLQEQVLNINNDVNRHNSKIESHIRAAIKMGKDKFKTQSDIISKLGNPRRQ